MAKQLYDYWFVQFDFPNEEGKPYKSSGGAMVWNDKLKREIPKEWMASNYTDLFTIGNGQTMPQNEGLVPAYGGNGIVKMVEISNYPACIIIGRVGANCGSIHYSKVPCWVSDNAISICSKNDNLEAMAKQLYDYWFVQFDFPNEDGKPYKSSGGAMTYNERLKREIPIGWEVENLIDFAEIKNGATPSTAVEANYGGDIVWITPKDLSDQQSKFVYQGERNITKQGFDSCSTSILPTNSVLMSSRAPIGLVSIAKHEICTNQGFKSFIPKSISDSIYLYYYINHHIKQIEQLGTGTTFKEVSRDDLCKFPILTIGAKNIYVQWIELQNGIADKQLALTKEIAALTKQRDELFPLLMNGQATVNYHLSDD